MALLISSTPTRFSNHLDHGDFPVEIEIENISHQFILDRIRYGGFNLYVLYEKKSLTPFLIKDCIPSLMYHAERYFHDKESSDIDEYIYLFSPLK